MNNLETLNTLIIEWANERNLIVKNNSTKQKLKLIEECGKLAQAILKNDVKAQKDAIGDIYVVVVILSEQLGKKMGDGKCNFLTIEKEITDLMNAIIYMNTLEYFLTDITNICNNLDLDLTECVNLAYNEIKDRKGKTINGTFIKES